MDAETDAPLHQAVLHTPHGAENGTVEPAGLFRGFVKRRTVGDSNRSVADSGKRVIRAAKDLARIVILRHGARLQQQVHVGRIRIDS